MTMRLVSFRFSEMEIEQVDQLIDLIRWSNERDGMAWRTVNRTEAIKNAVRLALHTMANEKRRLEEAESGAGEAKAAKRKRR